MRQNHIRPVNRLMSLVIAVLLALSCVPAALAEEALGTISYESASVNFGAYEIGYDVMTISDFDKGTPLKENQVAPHKMQITSSFDDGDTAAPLLQAALDGAAADKFELNTNEIPWNGSYYSNNFYIYPKKGLPVGSYNADIVISGEGVDTLRISANFEVATDGYEETTDIIPVFAAEMTVGETLNLEAAVEPSNATFKTITWSVADAGPTGAVISSGNQLTAAAAGTAKIRASVENGRANGTLPYTEDFDITVKAAPPPPPAFVPVTDIVGYPAELAVGTHIELLNFGRVLPDNATNRRIVWELVGTKNVITSYDKNHNVLSIKSLKSVASIGKVKYSITLRATVEGGLDNGRANYQKDIEILVAKPEDLTEYTHSDQNAAYTFKILRENGETFLGLKSLTPFGSATITVPSKIDISRYGAIPVKRIEDGALQADSANSATWAAIEEIALSEGIEAIGKDNLVGLTGLHTVTLPQSLKTLGGGCFRNLDALEEIELPASLEQVDDKSFIYNKSLRKVTARGNPAIVNNAATPADQLPFKSNAATLRLYGLPVSHLRDYATRRSISFSVIPEKWDYYKFANSYEDFLTFAEYSQLSSGRYNTTYTLTQRDWNRLKINLEKSYTDPGQAAAQFNALKDYADNSLWGGSCYGIALTEGLYNNNLLNTRNFGGTRLLSETVSPNQNENLRSMLNYHFLLQRLPEFGDDIKWAFESDSEYIYFDQPVDMTQNYAELVETAKQGPVLMSYYYVEDGVMYGHAVLVNGIDERTEGQHYRLTVEDNRYPGATALMELYLNEEGKLILRLPYNNVREEIIGIRYTGDFQQFYDAMPYDPAPDIVAVVTPFIPQLIVSAQEGWAIAAKEWLKYFGDTDTQEQILNTVTYEGETVISLNNIAVSALADGKPAPVDLIYNVPNGEDLTFTSQDGGAAGFSYTTDKGYASIRADGATQVAFTAEGIVDAQGLSGEARLATSAGDGTLVTVKAQNAAASNIRLEPGEKEATLTATPGSYEISMDTPDGRKTNTTVKSDGTPVTIQTPPDAPKSSGGGSTGFSAYWITAKAGPNGSITPEGETKVAFGESLTVTVTPDAGYTVDKVLLDGTKELTLTNGKYTFENVNEPYTIEATFKKADGGTEASGPNAPALPPETPAPNPATGDSWFSRLF